MLMLLTYDGQVLYTVTSLTRPDTSVTYNRRLLSSPYSSVWVTSGDGMPTTASIKLSWILEAYSPSMRAAAWRDVVTAAQSTRRVRYLEYDRLIAGVESISQSPVGAQSMRVTLSLWPASAYWTRDGQQLEVLP